jgi:ribonuclease P/MRP protein subunit POP7
MSAVKRVRKQLDLGLRRQSAAPKNASLQSRVEALEREQRSSSTSGVGGVEVTVMGTGRAVDKMVRLAGWFEQQGDCTVQMRTKTVGTVDDVVDVEGEAEDESRVRRMSCLEVVVKLK